MNGSELVLHEVATGSETVLHRTDDIVEAPNWSPDGGTIWFNGGGRLYRIATSGGAPEPVDTGFATKLNNDHGISPDGKAMAISDKVETGMSCIYLLDAAGGEPRRLTENVPSYWHGWAPDGGEIAYCAKRNEAFGIATLDLASGTERVLTDGTGHADGPDYSADGAWIWFNWDKTGSAEIWRVRRDGSAFERMTEDARVNWFPHPAPDGTAVLYLSYPEGTEGHPAGLNVELRLMDPDGGNIRTVAAFYGGQGSINVPCWEPGAARFAYMRYKR